MSKANTTAEEGRQNRQHNVASFLLRFTQDLYEDADHDAHVRWRGQIRHVQGDEESRFTDFADAVAFIQRSLTDLTADSLSGAENMSQEKIFAESFKLWEQFASSYTDIMQNAMEQTLKQSALIGKQVESARAQAIKAWQIPTTATTDTQREMLDMLKEMQRHLVTLSQRVDALEEKLNQESE